MSGNRSGTAAVLGLVLITCVAAVLGLAAFTTDVEQHPAPAPIPASQSRTD